MAFPDFKHRHILLGLFCIEEPSGWEDFGAEKSHSIVRDGEEILTWTSHKYCHTRVHIGRENGELFKFCPRCLLKVDDEVKRKSSKRKKPSSKKR